MIRIGFDILWISQSGNINKPCILKKGLEMMQYGHAQLGKGFKIHSVSTR